MAIKKENKKTTKTTPKKKATAKKDVSLGVKKAAKKAKKTVTKKTATKKRTVKDKPYYEAVGRRKRAVARVRLFTVRPFDGDDGKVIVNGKSYKKYFTTELMRQTVEASLRRLKSLNRFEISVKVSGGGLSAQADAIRHGISRALVKFNPDFRKKLRRAGFLTRDPRVKERKKFGLKKARRAPQWSKR